MVASIHTHFAMQSRYCGAHSDSSQSDVDSLSYLYVMGLTLTMYLLQIRYSYLAGRTLLHCLIH